MTIYGNQIIHNRDDVIQSSDLHLQYLRKDLSGKWSNKHVVLDGYQEIMFLNVFPWPIMHKEVKIDNGVTYDVLYDTAKNENSDQTITKN